MDQDGRFTPWLHGSESLSDLHRRANRGDRHSSKLELNRSCNRPVIDRRGRYLNRAQQTWLQRTIHFQVKNSPKSSQGTGEAAGRIVEHLIVRLVRCIKEDVGTVSGPDKLRAPGYVEERRSARWISLALHEQSSNGCRCDTRIVKPTYHGVRRTVGQLLRHVVLFHGADAQSILTGQIKRRHTGDPKQKNQQERHEKHVTLVAQIRKF